MTLMVHACLGLIFPPVRNLPEEQMVKQPIPIILDSNLQSPPSARLFRASRSPLIVYSQSSADPGLSERAHTLQKLGARLLAFDLRKL